MWKSRSYQLGMGILLCGIIVMTGMLSAVAMVNPATTEPPQRADVILIDGLRAFGALERPAVPFYHDKHTEALAKQGKDCLTCHEMLDAKLTLKFKRTEDNDRQTVMGIYHDQCIGCHEQGTADKTPSGPVTCGACHKEEGPPPVNRRPIALDKSLHYRHVKANDKKCETCHHVFNDQTKKLVYAKGEEGACLYCHGEVKEENRISYQKAAHQACVVCHREFSVKNKDAGPVECAGCHDPLQQAVLEKLDDVPRMERNQPNQVLVKTVSSKGGEPPANRMLPVPFDHKAHEGYNDSCRACHHASLTSCADCHSVSGSEDGRQVTLVQSMHHRVADSSCVGCHHKQQSKPQCAGCHAGIAQGQSLTSEAACKTCHMSTDAADPYPVDDAQRLETAERLLASRQPVTTTVAVEEIPEKVTIQSLSNRYEGAVMPHRRIVLKLAADIRGSRLAEYFHADDRTLCQGCHHNTPSTVKPPQCASCHGRTSEALNLTRPGLMAAYHQQCIQCHDKMGLEKPASRECTACHAKRK